MRFSITTAFALVSVSSLAGAQSASSPAASAPARATAGPAVAFVDVNIIPMDRQRVVGGQTVIVRGDRIESVGPSRGTRVPAGAIQVDGRGKYLMPGLAERHAHVLPAQDKGTPTSGSTRHLLPLHRERHHDDSGDARRTQPSFSVTGWRRSSFSGRPCSSPHRH